MTWLLERKETNWTEHRRDERVWTNEFSELCFPGFEFHFAHLADNPVNGWNLKWNAKLKICGRRQWLGNRRSDENFGFKGFSELKLFSNRIFMNHYQATFSSDDLCLETLQQILIWTEQAWGKEAECICLWLARKFKLPRFPKIKK